MNEFFQFALSSKVDDGNILHLRECSIKATCLQRFCVNFSWSQRILDRRGDIKYEAYHRKSWTLVRFQESSIDSFPSPPPSTPPFISFSIDLISGEREEGMRFSLVPRKKKNTCRSHTSEEICFLREKKMWKARGKYR